MKHLTAIALGPTIQRAQIFFICLFKNPPISLNLVVRQQRNTGEESKTKTDGLSPESVDIGYCEGLGIILNCGD